MSSNLMLNRQTIEKLYINHYFVHTGQTIGRLITKTGRFGEALEVGFDGTKEQFNERLRCFVNYIPQNVITYEQAIPSNIEQDLRTLEKDQLV